LHRHRQAKKDTNPTSLGCQSALKRLSATLLIYRWRIPPHAGIGVWYNLHNHSESLARPIKKSQDGPPDLASVTELPSLFSKHFVLRTFERCYSGKPTFFRSVFNRGSPRSGKFRPSEVPANPNGAQGNGAIQSVEGTVLVAQSNEDCSLLDEQWSPGCDLFHVVPSSG
jgi:hypothetical protein